MRLLLVPIALALVASLAPAHATTYDFATLNVPGTPKGINDSGQIVGSTPFYYDPSTSQAVYPNGYVLDTKSGSLTTFSVIGSSATQALFIDNTGRIGGLATDPNTNDSSIFVRDPSTGAFTVQQPFGDAFPAGLNAAGLLVGQTFASRFTTGFLLDLKTGTRTAPFSFIPSAINDNDQVVGSSGFLFDLKTGTSRTIASPGSLYSDSYTFESINNTGQIVVQAFRPVSDILHPFATDSFVYDLSSNTYTSLIDPDGSNTTAFAINDAGQVVGSYLDGSGTLQAFLATPVAPASVPEPASIALLAGSVCALAATRRRKPGKRHLAAAT